MKMSVRQIGQILWDYHHVNHVLRRCDWMIVLGSIDIDVAVYTAELVASGWAQKVIISGGIAHDDDLLRTHWHGQSEADKFAEVICDRGVDQSVILLENNATNTGENALFTKKLLSDRNIQVETALVVTKPYMERRAYATFAQQWPELETVVSSRSVTFDEYVTVNDRDTILNLMVGDLQRIKVYAERGYQISQEISDEVWNAYDLLVSAGYDKHLLR